MTCVMQWDYRQPVRIRFGNGSCDYLPKAIRQVGGRRGLLVTSPSFDRKGVAQRMIDVSEGLIADVYSHVTANPDVRHCDMCADMLRAGRHDFVVALGGGSVIDCAKAAAVVCRADKPTAYYLDGNPLPAGGLPIIAMPTTAGTGSEVTSVAVISDHSRGIKAPLSSDCFYPRFAIVDPGFTFDMPPRLTACTGFDVLCHAIEAYWSRQHQPVCDVLAVKAARLVLDNLKEACGGTPSFASRENMAEASVLAGLAFAQPRTNSAHVCSYPLTSRYGIPHGEACAMTIDSFIRLNASKGCRRTASLACDLGFSTPGDLADAVADLKRATGLRSGLAWLNLTPDDIAGIANACLHPNMSNNPVDVSYDDLVAIFTTLAAIK